MKISLPYWKHLYQAHFLGVFSLVTAGLCLGLVGCGGGDGGGTLKSSSPGLLNPLLASDVKQIIAQAVNHAISIGEEVVVAVTDSNGRILGEVVMSGVPAANVESLEDVAESRAGLGANFSSDGEAFTSETIAFIIDHHFPPENTNTAAAPLFGTENSSFPTGDVTSVAHFGNAVTGLLAGRTPAGNGQIGAIDGNLLPANFASLANGSSERSAAILNAIKGAIPLFRNDRFIGGLGVVGTSSGERNLDIALAGWRGFEAPSEIRANRVTIAGLIIPFGRDSVANPGSGPDFDSLLGSARISIPVEAQTPATPRDTPSTASGFPGAGQAAVFGGATGIIKNPIINSPNGGNGNGTKGVVTQPLTQADVQAIFNAAVNRARTARAGIRRPLGSFVVIHVAVVDQNGELLGCFAMDDPTVFSYDVAVQKARTCAFFSNSLVGFGCRSIGFLAQPRFPPGLDGPGDSAPIGPLFGLQGVFNPTPITGIGLDSGFQVFPGGCPLYRNGVLVGGVGISGDGVDQDDLSAFTGMLAGFDADSRRVDAVSNNNSGKPTVTAALLDGLNRIENAIAGSNLNATQQADLQQAVDTSQQRLQSTAFQSSFGDLESLPFVKLPNRPDL